MRTILGLILFVVACDEDPGVVFIANGEVVDIGHTFVTVVPGDRTGDLRLEWSGMSDAKCGEESRHIWWFTLPEHASITPGITKPVVTDDDPNSVEMRPWLQCHTCTGESHEPVFTVEGEITIDGVSDTWVDATVDVTVVGDLPGSRMGLPTEQADGEYTLQGRLQAPGEWGRWCSDLTKRLGF